MLALQEEGCNWHVQTRVRVYSSRGHHAFSWTAIAVLTVRRGLVTSSPHEPRVNHSPLGWQVPYAPFLLLLPFCISQLRHKPTLVRGAEQRLLCHLPPCDFELPNSEVSISSSAEWVTEPTLESLCGSLEGIGSEMCTLPRLALLFQA